jgi:hypothetical protein
MSDAREGAGPGGGTRPEPTKGNERREALIKLGKYAAYATPIVIASITAAHGVPISGAPVPPPP